MAFRRRRSQDSSSKLDRTQSPQSHSTTNLCTWDELPSWQKDNHHIRTNYRATSNSTRLSLSSLFYLHNEFVNIHSHVLGVSLFAGLSYVLYTKRDPTVSKADILAFASFFIGAVFCLSVSATYHAMSNHSPRISRIWHQADHVGIVAMILGSFLPSVYYGFRCDPLLQRVYWGMVCLPIFSSL